MTKYTYKKSDGEDIWTVGHDKDGKWIPESDWDDETFVIMRVEGLNNGTSPDAEFFTVNLRKRIEEMHEGYWQEQDISEYHRGAADACGLILDLPELRLFLPAKGEVE